MVVIWIEIGGDGKVKGSGLNIIDNVIPDEKSDFQV